MKDINKIKNTIAKLNRKCEKNHISLLSVLESMNISILKFLTALGLDTNLLNEELNNYLIILFNNLDTRISINPNMEDVGQEDIEIYSNNINTIFHFTKNRLTYNQSKKREDDLFIYLEEESIINDGTNQIRYYLETTTEKEKTKTRILTQKYPLKHMKIKVDYQTLEKSGAYEFTINDDMLHSDLVYILKCLNNSNFIQAFSILDRYPCGIKIIDEAKQIE